MSTPFLASPNLTRVDHVGFSRAHLHHFAAFNRLFRLVLRRPDSADRSWFGRPSRWMERRRIATTEAMIRP